MAPKKAVVAMPKAANKAVLDRTKKLQQSANLMDRSDLADQQQSPPPKPKARVSKPKKVCDDSELLLRVRKAVRDNPNFKGWGIEKTQLYHVDGLDIEA